MPTALGCRDGASSAASLLLYAVTTLLWIRVWVVGVGDGDDVLALSLQCGGT